MASDETPDLKEIMQELLQLRMASLLEMRRRFDQQGDADCVKLVDRVLEVRRKLAAILQVDDEPGLMERLITRLHFSLSRVGKE